MQLTWLVKLLEVSKQIVEPEKTLKTSLKTNMTLENSLIGDTSSSFMVGIFVMLVFRGVTRWWQLKYSVFFFHPEPWGNDPI